MYTTSTLKNSYGLKDKEPAVTMVPRKAGRTARMSFAQQAQCAGTQALGAQLSIEDLRVYIQLGFTA